MAVDKKPLLTQILDILPRFAEVAFYCIGCKACHVQPCSHAFQWMPRRQGILILEPTLHYNTINFCRLEHTYNTQILAPFYGCHIVDFPGSDVFCPGLLSSAALISTQNLRGELLSWRRETLPNTVKTRYMWSMTPWFCPKKADRIDLSSQYCYYSATAGIWER